MKAHLILTCTCAAALVLPFSSCSSQKSSTAGYDTAEPIANGGILAVDCGKFRSLV